MQFMGEPYQIVVQPRCSLDLPSSDLDRLISSHNNLCRIASIPSLSIDETATNIHSSPPKLIFVPHHFPQDERSFDIHQVTLVFQETPLIPAYYRSLSKFETNPTEMRQQHMYRRDLRAGHVKAASEELFQMVHGQVVITRYNGQPYMARKWEWKLSPASTFSRGPQEVEFQAYLKSRHGVDVHDEDQPMLSAVQTPNAEARRTREKLRQAALEAEREEIPCVSLDLNVGDESDEGSMLVGIEPAFTVHGSALPARETPDAMSNGETQIPMKRSHLVPLHLVPETLNIMPLRWEAVYYAKMLPAMRHQITSYMYLRQFERAIGVKFQDKALLRRAFTHPSHTSLMVQDIDTASPASPAPPPSSSPSPSSVNHTSTNTSTNHLSMHQLANHNQRLEFLGDTVLSFLVATRAFLFFRRRPPGWLASFKDMVVQNRNLAQWGRRWLFSKVFVAPPKSIELLLSNEKVYADCFEALLGAIYLDQGLKAAAQFLSRTVFGQGGWQCHCLSTGPNSAAAIQSLPETLHMHRERRFGENEFPCPAPPAEYRYNDRFLGHAWADPALLFGPLPELLLDTQAPLGQGLSPEWLGHLSRLVEAVGHPTMLQRPRLYAQAFTHPSYAKTHGVEDYERLEFLGDAILNLACSDFLYRSFPLRSEGWMTVAKQKLINNHAIGCIFVELRMDRLIRHAMPEHVAQLAHTAQRIRDDLEQNHRGDFWSFARVDRSEFVVPSTISDMFEAFLGAMYLDQGHTTCRAFLDHWLLARCDLARGILDAKSQLQHMAQRVSPTHEIPKYERIVESDASTATAPKRFAVRVVLGTVPLGVGYGDTLHAAQNSAAQAAIGRLVGTQTVSEEEVQDMTRFLEGRRKRRRTGKKSQEAKKPP